MTPKAMRELFGVMEMLSILILLEVKIHQTVHLKKSEVCYM